MIFDFLHNTLTSFLESIYSILPTFRVNNFLASLDSSPLADFMGYLNYFIPVKTMLSIGEGFVTLILSYNAFIIVKSWLKKVV